MSSSLNKDVIIIIIIIERVQQKIPGIHYSIFKLL